MNTADSSSAGVFGPKQGNTSLLISLIVNKEVICSVLELKKEKVGCWKCGILKQKQLRLIESEFTTSKIIGNLKLDS